MVNLADKLGICQWFHLHDKHMVVETVRNMNFLGIKNLRTDISWANFHAPHGEEFYNWMLNYLSHEGIEILPSVWHTPPSISEGGKSNSPPRKIKDYADFIDTIINRWGHTFDSIELWNEPNNRLKWDFQNFDPKWEKFSEMIAYAAHWAKVKGKRTVLGGISPVHHGILDELDRGGSMQYLDVIGIHEFPGMWDEHYSHGGFSWSIKEEWGGWKDKLEYINKHTRGKPIWVTETGFSTYHPKRKKEKLEQEQCERLREASESNAERVYFYSLFDLPKNRKCIEEQNDDGRVDEHEYHLGLITEGRKAKTAYWQVKALITPPGIND